MLWFKKNGNWWYYCQTVELQYFSVFWIQTQTHAVFGNITMLYKLFESYEIVSLARCFPHKKHQNQKTNKQKPQQQQNQRKIKKKKTLELVMVTWPTVIQLFCSSSLQSTREDAVSSFFGTQRWEYYCEGRKQNEWGLGGYIYNCVCVYI